mgnify:CR=1 FL=1
MSPKAILLNDMLNTLNDEDYDIIIEYIRLLSATRKKERAIQTIAAMDKFQEVIGEDKGWLSEDDMLEDMAAFRKERLSI